MWLCISTTEMFSMASTGHKKKTKSSCVQCARESMGYGTGVVSFESCSAFYERLDLGHIPKLQLECKTHSGRDLAWTAHHQSLAWSQSLIHCPDVENTHWAVNESQFPHL